MSQNNNQQQHLQQSRNSFNNNNRNYQEIQIEDLDNGTITLTSNAQMNPRQSVVSNTASMNSSRKLVYNQIDQKKWSISNNEDSFRNNAVSKRQENFKYLQAEESIPNLKDEEIIDKFSYNLMNKYVDEKDDRPYNENIQINTFSYTNSEQLNQSKLIKKSIEIEKKEYYNINMNIQENQNEEEDEADIDGMPSSSRALRKDMKQSDEVIQDASNQQQNIINSISIKGGRGRLQEGQYLEIQSNIQDTSNQKYIHFDVINNENNQIQQFSVQQNISKIKIQKTLMTQNNTQFELASRNSDVDQKLKQILKKGKISDIVASRKDSPNSSSQSENNQFKDNNHFPNQNYESAESLIIDNNSMVPKQFLQGSSNNNYEDKQYFQAKTQAQNKLLMSDKTPIKNEQKYQIQNNQSFQKLPVHKIMIQDQQYQDQFKKDSIKYIFHQNENESKNSLACNNQINSNMSAHEKIFDSFSNILIKQNSRTSQNLENTEQKETKAKGERMKNIIEMQMEAEYQNSINKIIEGTLKNSQGATNKSAQLQKQKKFLTRDRAFTIKMESAENPYQFQSEEMNQNADVSQFQNDDIGHAIFKRINNSFNLVINNEQNHLQRKDIENSFFGNDREKIDPVQIQSNSQQIENQSIQAQKKLIFSSANLIDKQNYNKSFTELAKNEFKIDEMVLSSKTNQIHDEQGNQKIINDKFGGNLSQGLSLTSQRQKLNGKPPIFINHTNNALTSALGNELQHQDQKINQFQINQYSQSAYLDQDSTKQLKVNSESSFKNYSKVQVNQQNNIKSISKEHEETKSQYINCSEGVNQLQNQLDNNNEKRNCLSQKSADKNQSNVFLNYNSYQVEGQIKQPLSQQNFNQMHIYLGTESDNEEYYYNQNKVKGSVIENKTNPYNNLSGRNISDKITIPHQILESQEDYLTNRILINNLREANEKHCDQENVTEISKKSSIMTKKIINPINSNEQNQKNDQLPFDVKFGLSDKNKQATLGYQQIEDEDEQQYELKQSFQVNHENININLSNKTSLKNEELFNQETFSSPQKIMSNRQTQKDRDLIPNESVANSDQQTQKRLAVLSQSSKMKYQHKTSQNNESSPTFKKQSIVSATSYKSDEIFTNMDEQVATREEYLNRIRQARRELLEGQDNLVIKINETNLQNKLDANKKEQQLTLKPLVFGGPSPGESLRDANLSLSSSRLNSNYKQVQNEQSAILYSEMSQNNKNGQNQQFENQTIKNQNHHQLNSMKLLISQSSAKKEKNFQYIGGLQQSASKISIQQIIAKSGSSNLQNSTQVNRQIGDEVSFDKNQPQNCQIAFQKSNNERMSINEVLNESSQINLSHLQTGNFQTLKHCSVKIVRNIEESQQNTPVNEVGKGLLQSKIFPNIIIEKNTSIKDATFEHIETQNSQELNLQTFRSNSAQEFNPKQSLLYSQSQNPILKRQSKIEMIKLEKKDKMFNERLVRQFNMKMFDKVIQELKSKLFQENHDRIATKLNFNDEELENELLNSSNKINTQMNQEEQVIQQEQKNAKIFGKFLYEAKGIDKQMVGYYFGENKKFNLDVCREFLNQFNFRRLSIDQCWRLIFSRSGLPKEGQQICRIMTVFQDVFLEQNKDFKAIQEWKKDTVWLLSVKLLDLNTNLHNQNVKAMLRYSKETFVEQSMKFPELKSAFTTDQIADMYDRISNFQFENKVSLHERYFKRINELSYSLVQHGIDHSGKNNNFERNSSDQQNKNWTQSQKKQIVKTKTLSKVQQAVLQEKYQIFKEKGTVFTKYGRYGEPKQRLVYLKEDESEIWWRNRLNEKEKPRKMLIKDLVAVLIGSDHTAVMRKQKIPPNFDNYCISIIGKERSLDLMIQDQKILQLWCEKIRQLIEQNKNEEIKNLKIEHSPESPNIGHQSELEFQIHMRDQCPESLEYIWKVEILNNLQKYWNPQNGQIFYNKEIQFNDQQLKNAIHLLIEQQGGNFLRLTDELKNQRPKSPQTNLDSMTNLRPLGQLPLNEYYTQKKQSSNILSCGFGQKLTSWATKSKNFENNQTHNNQNDCSKINKFFGIFNKKETHITLDQIWYRGLPNMARYCLWPILIGNQQKLNQITFEYLRVQVFEIRNKIQQLQALYQQMQTNTSAEFINKPLDQSHQQKQQKQNYSNNNPNNKMIRHSHLTSIISEREKEMAAEQSSLQIDQQQSLQINQQLQNKNGTQQEIEKTLTEEYIGIDNLTLKTKNNSQQEQNKQYCKQMFQDNYYNPSILIDSYVQSRKSNTINLDKFSEHMIFQFTKIQRKVQKITNQWEKAAVIGDFAADIPVHIFQQIMIDVLCSFLIHSANINGIQSGFLIQNIGNLKDESIDIERIQMQNLEQYGSYVKGMEKVLAPIVLIHLREQPNLDIKIIQKISNQVFICYSNIMLSSGYNQYQTPLFFLKHFITEDLAEIDWRMDFFDKLFERVLPQLQVQFKGINLKSEFFLHQWMMAMFYNVQGLEGIELILRIWDAYLLHGEPIIYCIALAILKSKLHKMNNAPMQTWEDFFSRIKQLKIPQQSLYYQIGSIAQNQRRQQQIISQGGTGESGRINEILFSGEDQEGGSQSGQINNQKMLDFISNTNSLMLIPLLEEALRIYVQFNVPVLYMFHLNQQMVAEHKNEIFTKMYLNDD